MHAIWTKDKKAVQDLAQPDDSVCNAMDDQAVVITKTYK
jgi:hypothetical protein